MTCQDARELFSARVDDALAPEERAGLDAHLAGCADCRRELARFEATVALLRAAEPARAPAGFVDRVLDAARPAPWHARLRARLVSPVALGRPLEVAAIALVALTAVYLYERLPELQRAAQEAPPPVAQTARPAFESESRPTPASPPARPAEPAKKKEQASKDQGAARPLAKAPAEAPVPPASATAPTAAPPAAPEAAQPAAAGRLSGAAATREREAEVAELRTKSAAPTGLASPSVTGTLAVADREAAARALAELVARLGGRQLGRRTDAGEAAVEVVVPVGKYPELVDGLARIGRWRPERQPAELPAQVRVDLRFVPD